jgi:tetratricopeptide (TPR) repeat protein
MSPTENHLQLEEAVDNILLGWKRTQEKKQPPPFVFIVGAGVSYPPVPLGGQIAADCEKIARARKELSTPPSMSPMETYSFWFERAFPDATDRQQYLAGLIKEKPISPANFRLAHLLLANTISNLVVTPNFDDFLVRAFSLFGCDRIRVCDHPGIVYRVQPENQDDIQIVHVHGTYPYYDLANLVGDIEARAGHVSGSAQTMLTLLDRIFADRSPIVIGYSGWDGDVIMTALRRRLGSPLARHMYWFCYSRRDFDALPSWVKRVRDVTFVVPPGTGELGDSPGPTGEALAEPTRREGTLPAQDVLDTLIRGAGLERPDLVRDPLIFFANRIECSLLHEIREGATSDLYSFSTVLRRIRRGAYHEERNRRDGERSLQQVADAVGRALYRESLQKAATIEVADLEQDDAEALVNAVWSAVSHLAREDPEGIPGDDLILVAMDSFKGLKEKLSNSVLFARSLNDKGIRLGLSGRAQEALAVFEDVDFRFSGIDHPEVRERVAWAIYNRGVALSELQRIEEAVQAYEEVTKRYGETNELQLEAPVARALYNMGFGLRKLGRNEDAMRVFDEVVKRFGAADDLLLREQVGRALLSKALALAAMERPEAEIQVYDELVKRFGEAKELELRERVAKALVNKGITLSNLGRNEEAVQTYSEVVERFGDSNESDLSGRVAKALVNKAVTLGALGRNEEAVHINEEVVKRYGGAAEPELQGLVAAALVDPPRKTAPAEA